MKKRQIKIVVFSAAIYVMLVPVGCASQMTIRGSSDKGISMNSPRNNSYSETADYKAAEKMLSVRTPVVRKAKEPLVMVHYMPWFQAPPVSDSYGFHWHQGGAQFNPYEVTEKGYANIASHLYPLTGPYDTRDRAVLEYQAALMKVAGIDGVIFDWYGIDRTLDYAEIQESVCAMIPVLEKSGLKFAVCYEDQSIGKMIAAGRIPESDALKTAKKNFDYMEKNWFPKEAYVKYEGRPVVYTFGPQYFCEKSQWEELFNGCGVRPYLVSLEGHGENFADGSFNWFMMNGTKTAKQVAQQLNQFFELQYDKPFLTATAFAEFNDIYGDAGGRSYGHLSYAQGKTFNLTLEAVRRANPDVVQIATWNDYGEGTSVEPTVQHGYEELSILQQFKKSYDDAFLFTELDLRAPLALYKILVAKDVQSAEKKYARDALDALLAGNVSAYHDAVSVGKITIDFAVRPIVCKPAGIRTVNKKPFDAGGRSNKALGMPTVASGAIYDFVSSKAVDGNVSTYWEGSADSYPNMLQVDVVTPCLLECAVIRLNPQQIWAKRTQTIAVQVSRDGTTFETVCPTAVYTFDPLQNVNEVVIPLNVTARYVRLVFSGNTGATAGQVAEFELYRKQ